MERRLKNWMFVSVALALAEIGQLFGASYRLRVVEWILDGLALLTITALVVRIAMDQWRK